MLICLYRTGANIQIRNIGYNYRAHDQVIVCLTLINTGILTGIPFLAQDTHRAVHRFYTVRGICHEIGRQLQPPTRAHN